MEHANFRRYVPLRHSSRSTTNPTLEPGTSGRTKFTFTNAPPIPHPKVSLSAARDSETLAEESSGSTVDYIDDTETSGTLPLPQTLISFPIDGELHTMGSQPLGDGSQSHASPRGSEAVELVSPQEVFGAPKPIVSIAEKTGIVPSVATQPLLRAPSSVLVPAPSSVLVPAPSSVLVPAPSSVLVPTPSSVLSSVLVPTPILDSCQAAVHPVVLESTPVASLPVSQTTAPEIPSNKRSGPVAAATSSYKVRNKTKKTKVTPATGSRRDSIEGAPDVILTLIGSGYELSEQPDIPASTTSSSATSSATLSSTAPFDELLAPSSQQSLEEDLTIPTGITTIPPDTPACEHIPSSQQTLDPSIPIGHFSLLAPRIIPSFRIDKSDIPSWLIESGRLDFVLSVEAGGLWDKLITIWLRQERRLGFGLNEKIVS
jgi:hypothetical protein